MLRHGFAAARSFDVKRLRISVLRPLNEQRHGEGHNGRDSREIEALAVEDQPQRDKDDDSPKAPGCARHAMRGPRTITPH